MKNTIRAGIEFYYQGEKITAYLDLDLDKIVQSGEDLSGLYPLLATAAEIDSYSYQYEMMLSEKIQFDQATGIAKDFVNGFEFDFAAFKQAWHKQKMLKQLEKIASQSLQIEDLETQPKIQQALIAAYRLGLANRD